MAGGFQALVGRGSKGPRIRGSRVTWMARPQGVGQLGANVVLAFSLGIMGGGLRWGWNVKCIQALELPVSHAYTDRVASAPLHLPHIPAEAYQ